MSHQTPSPLRGRLLLPAFLALFSLGAPVLSPAPRRYPTFDDRVKAQEAIERVYYSHQIGTTRPFEQAVSRELLEGKVRKYLKEDLALERFWKTPITAAMLRVEMERMARQTRLPGRLRELYAALGNDPILIQECLARPLLTNRLIRNFFAYDQAIHNAARRAAESLRADLLDGRIDPNREHPNRTVVDLRSDGAGTIGPTPVMDSDRMGQGDNPPRFALQAGEFDGLLSRLPKRPGEIGPLEEEDAESFHLRVVISRTTDELRLATFTVKKRGWEEWWLEVQGRFDERLAAGVAEAEAPLTMPMGHQRGDREGGHGTTPLRTASQPSTFTDCANDDTWDNGSLDDLPDPRLNHTAVWTGSVMIVWGGRASTVLNTGGRYDPATDTWLPTSTANTPAPRQSHTAVWTGRFMVVWGGFDGSPLDTGGRYDPQIDKWLPTSTENAPAARSQHTAVWTGSHMIIWGAPGVTGGRYDPELDRWTSTSTVNAPSERSLHRTVWTGVEMIVWGGQDCSQSTCIPLDTGGRYDPRTDAWSPISTANAPSARHLHTAVWTGAEMISWGGTDGASRLATGGRYDPASDTWMPTSTVDAPESRSNHHAVWTGDRMVVWGGFGGSLLDTGGRYDPQTDTWLPTSTLSAPSARQLPTVVWTGSLMIVWGGQAGFLVNTGARYDPASDTWTPTSTMNAPSPRREHTAVWTGTLMFVWGGGRNIVSLVNTGGRYDPATDHWTHTSLVNAPSPRWHHTAVWTGREMVLWGGDDETGIGLNTGGRYDPITDVWIPTTTTNVPAGRTLHTAVWSGDRMIVWGGVTFFEGIVDTGSRYDPETDTWAPTSMVNAPAKRYMHTATWTGNHMIVWGGTDDLRFFDTGGRYDPATDTWAPTSVANAPVARYLHTATWTDSHMFVWGGTNELAFFDTGGLYDPVADLWTLTSNFGAPSGRAGHTTLWTGGLMIVWGGSGAMATNTGARYDPAVDTWSPTSTISAPSARGGHTAVWTSGHMIVWGGSNLNNGGRYCSCSEATYYLDADGDGRGDSSFAVQSCVQPAGHVTDPTDCNDADRSTWEAPSEARELHFTDSTTLAWSAPLDLGASSVIYDLIRSESATDFLEQATCAASDSPEAGAADWTVPSPGRAFYYLARAENRCPEGLGSLGTDSNGTARRGRICP